MIQNSLRSKAGELAYGEAKKNGQTGDIAHIKGTNLDGVTLIPNEYPYDAFHKVSDLAVSQDSDFMTWWIRIGLLLQDGKLPYDQFLYNIGKMQSQPHIPHGHLLIFKDREDNQL